VTRLDFDGYSQAVLGVLTSALRMQNPCLALRRRTGEGQSRAKLGASLPLLLCSRPLKADKLAAHCVALFVINDNFEHLFFLLSGGLGWKKE
jgi:hypothetical protein